MAEKIFSSEQPSCSIQPGHRSVHRHNEYQYKW